MNTRDHANQLLQQIASEFPPEVFADSPAAFDENNQFFLSLEENLAFIFYMDDESRAIIINVPLAKLPDGPARDTIMLELLRANYGWNLTEGGTLGVDAETDLICLGYLVPLPLEVPEQMPQIVNKLASVAQHWQRMLAEMNVDDVEPSEAPEMNMMRA